MSIASFESEHAGIVHSTVYDYYGKRLATCGSDGKINIFEASDDSMIKVSEQSRHEHSVWDISWSHPRFGVYLASVGFDKKVIIYKEQAPNLWKRNFLYQKHTNSVNSCEFVPNEYGLILLCGSSDGYISLHELKGSTWNSMKILAHASGVNCVSIGPAFFPVSFKYVNEKEREREKDKEKNVSIASFPPMRFVTGGCDKLVKVWTTLNDNHLHNKSICDSEENFGVVDLEGHKDWVRDVSWLQYVGYEYDTIASCSEDETVKIWKYEGSEWKYSDVKKIFGCPTWKTEWSHCGTYLAVSSGDNCVYIFMENSDGIWEESSKITQSSTQQQQQLLND